MHACRILILAMRYSDRYLLFIEYFNNQKFTSAQSTLDEVWLDETGSDKNYYGGLVQISVSLYHLTNDNAKGAQKIFEKAHQMLSPFGEKHLGISVSKLLSDMAHIFSHEVSGDRTNFDYLKLAPKIEFEESVF